MFVGWMITAKTATGWSKGVARAVVKILFICIKKYRTERTSGTKGSSSSTYPLSVTPSAIVFSTNSKAQAPNPQLHNLLSVAAVTSATTFSRLVSPDADLPCLGHPCLELQVSFSCASSLVRSCPFVDCSPYLARLNNILTYILLSLVNG